VKNILFRLVCRLFCWSGLPWLLRERYARHKITIVNYHNPIPEIFKQHARFFYKNYSFVSIDQVVCSLKKSDLSSLPPKPLLLTFDDGYAGNALLFPILRHYKIPATIYTVAGVIGTNRHFWFDKLPHHGEDMRTLKQIPDNMRRKRMKMDYDHCDEKEYDSPVALSIADINSFADLGGTVGSHTLFHPLLDKCEQVTGIDECQISKITLEKLTGKHVIHFALPNGNLNEDVLQWICNAGYQSCRTTKPGWVNPDTSPFLLPTFGIDDNADTCKAALQACGLWSLLKTFTPKSAPS